MPPEVVRRVLDDVDEYPRFMPYVTEGSWLLEPTSDGRQTRATYCIYSDSGGSLPTYIVNAASKTAIPKLFEAIRKQAQLKKYSAAR